MVLHKDTSDLFIVLQAESLQIGPVVSLINACLLPDLVHSLDLLELGELVEELLRHIRHLGYEGHMFLFEFKLRNLITPAEINNFLLRDLLHRVGRVSLPKDQVYGLFVDL